MVSIVYVELMFAYYSFSLINNHFFFLFRVLSHISHNMSKIGHVSYKNYKKEVPIYSRWSTILYITILQFIYVV